MSSEAAPVDSSVNPVVQKNIRTLLQMRRQEEKQASLSVHVSDAITRFSGSMSFLAIHAAILVFWLSANSGHVPGVHPWDPYPFVMLAMAASVEAIFLSTFVLISQNRQAVAAERRAELDLQIGLLTEHEVTRLIQMVERLLQKENIPMAEWPDLNELKCEVAPERVLTVIERELL